MRIKARPERCVLLFSPLLATMKHTRVFKFDVRKLLALGIEPFPEIRKRVDALKPAEGIVIIAPFLPAPLIERLQSEGFKSRSEHQADGSWSTQFWREDDAGGDGR
jgi:hypothetical protein